MPSSESSWLIGENLRDVPLNSAQCLEARRIKSRTTFSTTKMDPRSRTQGDCHQQHGEEGGGGRGGGAPVEEMKSKESEERGVVAASKRVAHWLPPAVPE
ncbi:hypothetical protein HN011_008178 [Eciton burchellii]|nr:hypothetical protein HN011_008178 [Eciton burchellii]